MRGSRAPGLPHPVVYGMVFLLSTLLVPPAALTGESAAVRDLYLENCAPCHGNEGRGNGPGVGALPVKPADHTDPVAMGIHTDEYLFNVIAEGGMGVGRSPLMPAWGEQLTESQIASLVAYIRTLSARAID